MEQFQCMTMMKLNKNKRIGKVLFIVEGEKTEIFILKKIFNEVLGYNYASINRRGKTIEKFSSINDIFSMVLVINSEKTNISSIEDGYEYLDNMFTELNEKHGFMVEDARIYYLFDRDRAPGSNSDPDIIKQLLRTLKNSQDNGYDKPGMLLLSYPAIESFTLENFYKNTENMRFELGNELKNSEEYKKINQSKISDSTLKDAVNELQKKLTQISINYDIDDMSEANINIFDTQEEIYNSEKKHMILSLLAISLIDLGLIEIEND